MQADISNHSLSLSERIELKDHFNLHPEPLDICTCKPHKVVCPGMIIHCTRVDRLNTLSLNKTDSYTQTL